MSRGWICPEWVPFPPQTWDTTDAVGKRAVRILLECFLVINIFVSKYIEFNEKLLGKLN